MMKEFFKRFISGLAIGVGAAIPGISGGTIAVILRVYEKIVWAVSNIFKHFKEAIRVLLPVLLGVIIAIIPMLILMKVALNQFLFGIVCLFAGFILGSFPSVTDEIRKEKAGKGAWIILFSAFLFAALIGIGSALSTMYSPINLNEHFANPEVWFYFVLIPVGAIASSALVVPGISGSMIMLIMGFYSPLVNNTVDVLGEVVKGNWSHFGTLIGVLGCFFIGVLIGFYLISKLMNTLLTKYKVKTYYGIIGFILGSFISLYINKDMWLYYDAWAHQGHGAMSMTGEMITGVALFIVAVFASYFLVRYISKVKNSEQKPAE